MTPPEAAPPHSGPLPPWKGIMNGSSLSGGSICTVGRDCAVPPKKKIEYIFQPHQSDKMDTQTRSRNSLYTDEHRLCEADFS